VINLKSRFWDIGVLLVWAAIIQPDHMERVFTDINADHGNCAVERP
jgi:hypothetical protein